MCSFDTASHTRAVGYQQWCRFVIRWKGGTGSCSAGPNPHHHCVCTGRVEGVLWYFPFENDQETVPLDPHTMGRMLLMANRGLDGAATQNPTAAGGLRALTQLGGPTQVAALQTQRQTQAVAAMGRKQGQVMEQDTPELEAAGEGFHCAAHGCMAPSTSRHAYAAASCDVAAAMLWLLGTSNAHP